MIFSTIPHQVHSFLTFTSSRPFFIVEAFLAVASVWLANHIFRNAIGVVGASVTDESKGSWCGVLFIRLNKSGPWRSKVGVAKDGSWSICKYSEKKRLNSYSWCGADHGRKRHQWFNLRILIASLALLDTLYLRGQHLRNNELVTHVFSAYLDMACNPWWTLRFDVDTNTVAVDIRIGKSLHHYHRQPVSTFEEILVSCPIHAWKARCLAYLSVVSRIATLYFAQALTLTIDLGARGTKVAVGVTARDGFGISGWS